MAEQGQLLFPQSLQIYFREKGFPLLRLYPALQSSRLLLWQPVLFSWVHVVPGYLGTQGFYTYMLLGLSNMLHFCVQMNKQNSISSKSLSIKHNIFVKGESPRTKQGAISWTLSLAFRQAYLYTKISLSTQMVFFLRERVLLCCSAWPWTYDHPPRLSFLSCRVTDMTTMLSYHENLQKQRHQ